MSLLTTLWLARSFLPERAREALRMGTGTEEMASSEITLERPAVAVFPGMVLELPSGRRLSYLFCSADQNGCGFFAGGARPRTGGWLRSLV